MVKEQQQLASWYQKNLSDAYQNRRFFFQVVWYRMSHRNGAEFIYKCIY